MKTKPQTKLRLESSKTQTTIENKAKFALKLRTYED